MVTQRYQSTPHRQLEYHHITPAWGQHQEEIFKYTQSEFLRANKDMQPQNQHHKSFSAIAATVKYNFYKLLSLVYTVILCTVKE
jgi:hypothetical protein